MPQLRVVLYGLPPLLADLIQHVVAARFERKQQEQYAAGQSGADLLQIEFATASEADVLPEMGASGGRAGPNIVIKWANPVLSTRTTLPVSSHSPVLTLSSDLTRIHGPGEDDCAALTPNALANILYDIAMKI